MSEPAESRTRSRRSLGARLLRALALLTLAFVLATGVPVLLLRWCAPLYSAFMLRALVQASLEHESDYHTLYHWVALERISPHAALAVIASEDQQFPFHAGFDVDSIRQAVRASERGKRLRGASTISQQVAKNLFLWPGRSLARKGLEAWFTVLIETLWPKERILEMYLNIVELGRGIYGVEAAAQSYFHRPAARLTREQAALLAAVLPNPHRMHASRPSAYVLARQDWILNQMRRLGGSAYLSTIEKQRAHPP